MNAIRPVVMVEGLQKTYRGGRMEVHALRGVSFSVEAGEVVAVVGRSGSGKTTLLNLIGGLDHPDSGRVTVDGAAVNELDEGGRLRLRREQIGFVFQSFGLLPFLSARENIEVPLRLLRTPRAERTARAGELLDMVGLTEHAEQRPAELSGGQQQRVAIARALANQPRLLLGDEPTGQLDSETGLQVVRLVRDLAHQARTAAIIATHDPLIMEIADNVLHLADGALQPSSDGTSIEVKSPKVLG